MTTSSFTQGAPLPNITTTQNQQTTAPGFYTDYLNNLATQGQNAATNSQYVGAQPLQQQAFNQVGQNVGNYQPALNQAQNLVNQAGNTNIYGAGSGLINAGASASPLAAANPYLNAAANPTYNTVGNFMSPYTQSVVNSIGALGQNNIANVLAPQATAGIVGSGQFGSQRGVGALGDVLSNAALGITGQQSQALESGYNTALQAAQNQANLYGQLGQTAGQFTNAQAQNQLTAGQNLGALASQQAANQLNAGNASASLAGQTQNLGLNDVNALATLGGQQQTIAQNQQLFPMQQLTNESALLRGYSIPTGTSSTYTGPIPGAYQASPLQQIAGLGALAAGVSNTNLGSMLFGTPASGAPNSANYVPSTQGLFGQGISGISKWLTGGTSLTNMNTSHSEGGQIVMPEEITSTPKKTKRSSKTKKVD